MAGMTIQTPPFRHLLRLTDRVGLFEQAEGVVPRVEHGYCVDDVARGLLVVCREPAPRDELITLARRYVYFLTQAQGPDGRCRNRLGHNRHWGDEPGTQDCWGRALWGLGTAASRGPTVGVRGEARALFDSGARVRSELPHAMAFAALGAAEILDLLPGHGGALSLLEDAVTVIGEPPASAAWPWPAPRLRYANAAIAEAVIVAGERLKDRGVLRGGLRMLQWLLAGETRDGHLSVVPVGGWGPGEPRPGFDQRPIEVAALADACVRAAAVTGDSGWLDAVGLCVAWFFGDNDAKVPVLDERTGGCCDSLSRTGRSRNQGAESTLAMISVLQQGRRLPGSGQEARRQASATAT
jgi:hypothetical protein